MGPWSQAGGGIVTFGYLNWPRTCLPRMPRVVKQLGNWLRPN